MPPTFIRKRDGRTARFELNKIAVAISKAAHDLRIPIEEAEEISSRISNEVSGRLNGRQQVGVPEIENLVVQTSRDLGYDSIANAYQIYMQDRAHVRDVLSVLSDESKRSTTDAALMIESTSKDVVSIGWQREKIIAQLQEEAGLDRSLAKDVAKRAEIFLVKLYDLGLRRISTTQIRQLVDISMEIEGLETPRKTQTLLGIPTHDLEALLFSKNQENSNVASNNSEAVQLGVAEPVLKQYALNNVFSQDVADAHRTGRIHLHDLGYITRVYCSAHSLEYIKKFGLNKALANLESKSNAPNSAAVLNQHVQTFLASKQADFAGALGFGFLNIFYSSLLNRPVDVVYGVLEGKELSMEKRDLEKLVEQCVFKTRNLSPEEIEEEKRKIRESYSSKISPMTEVIKSIIAGENVSITEGLAGAFALIKREYEVAGHTLYPTTFVSFSNKPITVEEFTSRLCEAHKKGKEGLESLLGELVEAQEQILDGKIIPEPMKEELQLLDKKQNAIYFEIKKQRKEMKEVSQKEYEQTAQNLIFAASQNAFSRGGQTLFIDFNIHTGVPDYMREVPAVGPGGKYMVLMQDGSVEQIDKAPRFENPDDKEDRRNGDAHDAGLEGKLKGGHIITYGDLEETSQKFALAMLKVWENGDKDGRPFHFPKCDLHVDENSFRNAKQKAVLNYAEHVISKNGSVYIMFDRGDKPQVAQCCRLKQEITDFSQVKNPEKLRFVGFQNVTINFPQAAYRGVKLEGVLDDISKSMELAYRAHMQKKAFIQKELDTDGSPLRGDGLACDDGTPYIDLQKATYIIGMNGLDEAVKHLTGKQLHESEEAYRTGLKIVAHMHKKIKEFSKRSGLNFTLEETPAESTTRRFAKLDLLSKEYGEAARKVVKGTEENPYYTNSIHFAPNAAVSLVDRIVGQSRFHDMIASGAIIHAYIGEHRPDEETIEKIIYRTLKETRCSQLVFSPTYTECDECGIVMPGDKKLCVTNSCANHNEKTLNPQTISTVTRVVGYNSRIRHWNGSQQQVFEDRKQAEDQYAGGNGIDMGWLYNPNGHERLLVLEFGKTGCMTCENTQQNITKELDRMGLNGNIDYRVIHLDKNNPDDLALAAMYDVPLDTVPTVVIAGRNDYWKKTVTYAVKQSGCKDGTCNVDRQRSDLIKPAEIRENLRARAGDYGLTPAQ